MHFCRPREAIATPNMSRSACDKVFGTTELLEDILLYLKPLEILVLQRVSRNFLDCVADSPGLQRKLFYKASTAPPEEWLAVRSQDIAGKLHHDFTFVANFDRLKSVRISKIVPCTPLRICPTLEFNDKYYLEAPSASLVCGNMSCFLKPSGNFVGNPLGGSWERMFLTKPACTRATMFLRWERSCGDVVYVRRDVEDEAGIRMGILRKASSMVGDVDIVVQRQSHMLPLVSKEHTTAEEAMSKTSKKGGRASYKLKRVAICLEGVGSSNRVAIPSTAEWEKMSAK